MKLYSLHLMLMTMLDMFVGTKMIATWSVVIGVTHLLAIARTSGQLCVCDVILCRGKLYPGYHPGSVCHKAGVTHLLVLSSWVCDVII